MNFTVFSLFLSILPLFGVVSSLFFKRQQAIGMCSALFVWIGLVATLILSGMTISWGTTKSLIGFQLDSIAMLLMVLIFFISAVVHQFSIRYVEGRSSYREYFAKISCLTTSLLLMVQSDHFLLFTFLLTVCNALLSSLIGIETDWAPSRESARLTKETLCWVTVLLGISSLFVYFGSGTLTIPELKFHSNVLCFFALVPIVIAAFIQSSLFPFQKALVSSLNAPSTVSAFMHAGLVNGGGIILIKISTLIENQTFILDLILIVGFVSVVLGTGWKIIQSSVKSSLVFSTISQMGFMFMQCGLGLFSAALAHLIWHSLFKAFLFMRTGSALTENIRDQSKGVSLLSLGVFSISALPATWIFAKTAGYAATPINSTFVLVAFAFFAFTQLMISVTQNVLSVKRLSVAVGLSLASAVMYGFSVGSVEWMAFYVPDVQPNPLTTLHVLILMVATMLWSFHNLRIKQVFFQSELWKNLYVRLLNSSQPQSYTQTTSSFGL